ncbi:MAG: nitrilase family protein, partial [Muribaculaceae bacterium]|nr:nitrilase family protein [Muribaculaceae bacterium]
MNETVTIAIIPLDIVQADKDSNLRNVASIMQSIDPATDVVVLPELFSTGFISDNNLMHTLSESNNGSTMDQIRNMARRYNMAICGTFLARTGDTYYN